MEDVEGKSTINTGGQMKSEEWCVSSQSVEENYMWRAIG